MQLILFSDHQVQGEFFGEEFETEFVKFCLWIGADLQTFDANGDGYDYLICHTSTRMIQITESHIVEQRSRGSSLKPNTGDVTASNQEAEGTENTGGITASNQEAEGTENTGGITASNQEAEGTENTGDVTASNQEASNPALNISLNIMHCHANNACIPYGV